MRELKITRAITTRETRSVEAYFSDIGRIGLLSEKEESLLALRIRQGDRAAAERMIAANLRFVVSVAKKYQHHGMPLEDLISEGNLGLIKAAHRFDETRGFKFISFAVWWIRQSIMLAISEKCRMVQLPLNHINAMNKLNRAEAEMESRLERRPTYDEISDQMGIPPERLRDTHYHSGYTMSYDVPVSGDDDYPLVGQLSADDPSPDSALLENEQWEMVFRLLEQLPARERQVVELSFGIGIEWPLMPADIGTRLGMSGERVRQLKFEALAKLHEMALSLQN